MARMPDEGIRPRGASTRARLIGLALSVAIALGNGARAEDAVTFVAFGDMPYGAGTMGRYRDLLAAIAALGAELVIHVGDTKSGGANCTDADQDARLAEMRAMAGALVYTPGDNEWTDCHRGDDSRFADPGERLERIRRLYFAGPESLGAAPLALVRQADVDPGHADYVENTRWRLGPVLFGTVHVVGSNNNHDDAAEFAAREAAGLAWIEELFVAAFGGGTRAVVIALHADMFFPVRGRSGFARTVAAIEAGARDFGGPVLLIHGDSHVFEFDRPFIGEDGMVVPNLWRLEVPGSRDMRAVRVTVEPAAEVPFSVLVFGPGPAGG